MKKLTNILCICLISTLSSYAKSANSDPKNVNIVLINVDDLGWTDLSFMGSEYYETPNVDKLRTEGVYFPNAYAGAANCAPSRACLMTGQTSPRHGIYTVGSPRRGKEEDRNLIPCDSKREIDPSVNILPKALQANGYQTCTIGKWHLGSDPTKQGFDINFGGYSVGHPKSYFSPYRNPNLKDGPKGEYLSDRLGNEAVNFIKHRDKTKPFFLYYANYEVHTPLQAPEEVVNKYKQKKGNKQHKNATYAAMVEAMDNNLGKILNSIEDEGIRNNTVIIFTSDNGGVYNISKQWPLRAGKGSFYEGGIRVPMIFVWDNKIEPNTTNNSIISQLDLYPTIMNISNSNSADGYIFDGIDISQNLFGGIETYNDRTLFWHFPAYLEGGNKETKDVTFRTRPVSVIRQGSWKLIENFEGNTLELYNIDNDISETNDLSTNKEYSKIKKRLYKQLKAWQKETNACIPVKK